MNPKGSTFYYRRLILDAFGDRDPGRRIAGLYLAAFHQGGLAKVRRECSAGHVNDPAVTAFVTVLPYLPLIHR